jgi:Zn-dependent protease
MGYSSRISSQELLELLISFIILTTAFTLVLSGGYNALQATVNGSGNAIQPDVFFIAGLGVGTGFLLHELAHKFVAQRFGYEAEYKAWPMGLGLTLLMSLMGFIIALPGAVMIHKTSYSSRSPNYTISDNDDSYWDSLEQRIGGEELWISLAGPITNIILSAIFFALLMSGMLTSDLMVNAAYYALYINLILAAFNLLPIRPMDGEKIFRGNPVVWVIIAVPTILIALGFMFGVISIF